MPKPKGMRITALASWYGTNRTLAPHLAHEFKGCTHVTITNAGGLADLVHIPARTIIANDLHCHVMNLGAVVSDKRLRHQLHDQLRHTPHHSQVLADAQHYCQQIENGQAPKTPNVEWAAAYFITSWQARSGRSGTKTEFKTPFSVRWDANGGDSATRWRNNVRSLAAWGTICERCTFLTKDCFEIIEHVKDQPRTGVYSDPPWPKDGDPYRHGFTEKHHRDWAARLSKFKRTKIVIRYGDHPLIRELYPADQWTIRELTSRTGANKPKRELLITNRPTSTV
jgi:hypothetical protein